MKMTWLSALYWGICRVRVNNRPLNSQIKGGGHPSFESFVHIILQDSKKYWRDYLEIINDTSDPIHREEIRFPEVPEQFL